MIAAAVALALASWVTSHIRIVSICFMQPGEAKASKARAAVVDIFVRKFVGIFTGFLQAFAGILREFLQVNCGPFL